MPAAHLCRRCGYDLARQRARREPNYGWFVTQCPDCNGWAVRRRHPLVTGFRGLRRADWALTVVVFNLLAGLGLAGILASGVVGIVRGTSDRSLASLWSDDRGLLITLLVLIPIAFGTWLRAGLGHWPRRAAWLTAAALVLAIVTVAVWLDAIAPRIRLLIEGVIPSLIDRAFVVQTGWTWLRAVTLVHVLMVIALAAAPLGRGLLWSFARARRALWSLRRRRGRRERVGHA